MHRDSAAKQAPTAPPIGQGELAEGLMLVRASTLKMIRLHLAMERHDRRTALEAVDDLVALDRSMQDYLAGVAGAQDRAILSGELEGDRVALNREKLTLAAQIITGHSPPPQTLERSKVSGISGPEEVPIASEDGDIAEDCTIGEPWPEDEWTEYSEPARRHRTLWWAIGLLVLLSAIAGAAFFLGVPEGLALVPPDLGVLQ